MLLASLKPLWHPNMQPFAQRHPHPSGQHDIWLLWWPLSLAVAHVRLAHGSFERCKNHIPEEAFRLHCGVIGSASLSVCSVATVELFTIDPFMQCRVH
jgi:hypothetical protein